MIHRYSLKTIKRNYERRVSNTIMKMRELQERESAILEEILRYRAKYPEHYLHYIDTENEELRFTYSEPKLLELSTDE